MRECMQDKGCTGHAFQGPAFGGGGIMYVDVSRGGYMEDMYMYVGSGVYAKERGGEGRRGESGRVGGEVNCCLQTPFFLSFFLPLCCA